VVLRTKQYLAAIRPVGNALVMSTLLFHDDVVPQKEIGDLPTRAKSVPPKQVKMAGQIIESLTTDWKPERYSDTYKEKVLEMIKKKAKGEEIVAAEDEAPDEQPADLMAALEASLEAAKANRKRPSARRKKSA
jgi:DNA end-binding protein Ku